MSIGQTVGGYRLTGHLGGGQFSQVLKARCMQTNDKVALKVVSHEVMDKTPSIQNEMEIHRNLEHPNILPVHDVVTIDGHQIFVMDRARHDLFECIPLEVGLHPEVCRDVFIQLLDALSHVHGVGFVHRDIKPENILVGDGSHIYLTDFGFATEHEDENKEPLRLTQACGSMYYAAPEILDRDYLGKPADVWSAGVTLFAMLTGLTPWNLACHESWEFTAAMEGNFNFAPWNKIIDPALEILKAIFVLDPEERATIPEIRQMSWIAEETWRHHSE